LCAEGLGIAGLLLGLNHGERAGQQLVAHDGALIHVTVFGEGPGRDPIS
jgi:hypothetical protein